MGAENTSTLAEMFCRYFHNVLTFANVDMVRCGGGACCIRGLPGRYHAPGASVRLGRSSNCNQNNT